MKNPLYRFAHSHRILTPFARQYGCGWFDGGCFVFARALQLWLGGRLAVIVRRELFHERMFDHAVLSLPDVADSSGPLYVDADGVATADELLECWRARERVPDPALVDPADRVRFVGHLEKELWSSWLAQELETRFGTPDGVNSLACWAEPHKEPFMNDHVSLPATRSTGAERSMAKRALNLDQCATCNNARVLPHPDLDKAESLVIPCPDCSQITLSIRKKYLAAPSAYPWCGGAIQADAAPEVDEAGVATQEIDCTECNRRWCDVYRLSDMRRL